MNFDPVEDSRRRAEQPSPCPGMLRLVAYSYNSRMMETAAYIFKDHGGKMMGGSTHISGEQGFMGYVPPDRLYECAEKLRLTGFWLKERSQ